jgi:hypothetical protein
MYVPPKVGMAAEGCKLLSGNTGGMKVWVLASTCGQGDITIKKIMINPHTSGWNETSIFSLTGHVAKAVYIIFSTTRVAEWVLMSSCAK